MSKEMTGKEKRKMVAELAFLAFMIGASLAIGTKTVNAIWPDAPVVHIIKEG